MITKIVLKGMGLIKRKHPKITDAQEEELVRTGKITTPTNKEGEATPANAVLPSDAVAPADSTKKADESE